MSPLTNINLILCPIDFSERSIGTLGEAAALAKKLDAKLLIMNVVNQKVFEDLERYQGRIPVLDGVVDKAYGTMQEENAKRMEAIMAEVDLDGVDFSSWVTVGIPWEKILETADEQKVDLIVMGFKGRGAVTRHLRFGSSAEKVFRRAKCRVMFIRGVTGTGAR